MKSLLLVENDSDYISFQNQELQRQPSTDGLFSFVDLPSISMCPDHCPRSYSTSTSAPLRPVPERLTVSLRRLYTSIFQKLICIFLSLFTMVCMVCMVCIASMVRYV